MAPNIIHRRKTLNPPGFHIVDRGFQTRDIGILLRIEQCLVVLFGEHDILRAVVLNYVYRAFFQRQL